MKAVAILLCLTSLSGCADTLLSDNRIRSNTAGVLGQSDSAVVIGNRRDDGLTNTYYTARTPHGTFACTINGGGLLALGEVNAPVCNRL